MKKFLGIMAIAALALALGTSAMAEEAATTTSSTTTTTEAEVNSSLLTIPFKDAEGETKTLSDFNAKAVLIVNTASRCGHTPQYAELEELYNQNKEKGLVILAFPANNFGNQEPGTMQEIVAFCQENYGVTFPVMSKVEAKGESIDPLFDALTGKGSVLPGEIKWNFEKFLIDEEGTLVARFPSRVRPLSEEITSAVAQALE